VCGNAKDVQTRTIGLDGKTFEIDLCPKDSRDLSKTAAGYVSKARKNTVRRSARHNGHRPRSRAAIDPQQKKGIYVYGIFPADIEMAVEMPGVGEHPGLIRVIHSDSLAALISEVDLPGRPGSPEDLSIHREILDAAAVEVPVLPLDFGTILSSEEAVAEELLGTHRDEFHRALEELEGRAEFLVEGHYVDQAATANREEDTRALQEAMEGHCVASVVREPSHELEAVNVAFLVETDEESDVEQVITDLARDWAGRIEVQLLGPMAAYDFVEATKRQSDPGLATR
jgi:hypothetical protein